MKNFEKIAIYSLQLRNGYGIIICVREHIATTGVTNRMIKLDREAFEAAQRKHGWNETQLARVMGIARETIWRAKTGETRPGEAFVAATLRAFPEMKFEDLFFLN
jgi:DNA-binding XRE family transcriptional regulator